MHSYCNYDTSLEYNATIENELSDCSYRCYNYYGCNPIDLGNGICDKECSEIECGLD